MRPAFAEALPIEEPRMSEPGLSIPAPAPCDSPSIMAVLDGRQEQAEIIRLQSADPAERREAVRTLISKGSPEAAARIETLMLGNSLRKAVKRDMREVLLSLSFKQVSALSRSDSDRFRRQNAICASIRIKS